MLTILSSRILKKAFVYVYKFFLRKLGNTDKAYLAHPGFVVFEYGLYTSCVDFTQKLAKKIVYISDVFCLTLY